MSHGAYDISQCTMTTQLTSFNNYLSKSSSYITPKLVTDFVLGITYPKPSSICRDECNLDMVSHQHFQAHKTHYQQTPS